MFFFILFVSEAFCLVFSIENTCTFFIRHLSLSPQQVITEVSLFYLQFITILCTYYLVALLSFIGNTTSLSPQQVITEPCYLL